MGASTPERSIKSRVKDVLNKYGVYYLMPVQMGLGGACVDFHCVMRWRNMALAFFIETKKPGGEPTERQKIFLKRREEEQNAKTFVVDGYMSLMRLREWIDEMRKTG